MLDLRLLVLDVDGVLTDGRLGWGYFGSQHLEPMRFFHVHDGIAIQWFRRHLGEVALLTAKESHAVRLRADELGLKHVIQGSRDKLADLNRLREPLGVSLEQVAMMGDDFPDLCVLQNVGYPLAPSNAANEVRTTARFVTERPGGHGAVREAIEHLLRETGKWSLVQQQYGLTDNQLDRQAVAGDGSRS